MNRPVEAARGHILRQLFLAGMFVIGLMAVVSWRNAMPASFSFDNDAIQELVLGVGTVERGNEWLRPAAIYSALGLVSPELAGLVTFALFTALLAITVRGRLATASHTEVIIVGVVILIGAVILGQFTKDAFVLIVTGIAIVPIRSRWSGPLLLVTIGFYAWWFRTYWWLILGAYVIFLWSMKRGHSLQRLFLTGIGLLAALAAIFPLVRGVDVIYYRYAVNVDRIGSPDATTMVAFDLPGGLLGSFASAVLAAASFIFPWPLFQLLTPFHVANGVLIATMWALVLRAIARRGRNLDAREKRWVSLILAQLTIQAIYTPDYGSYLRHLAPLLPLMVGVLFSGRRHGGVSRYGRTRQFKALGHTNAQVHRISRDAFDATAGG